MTLGERLKALRADKKITMHDLAQKLGIGMSTISQYENGRREPNISIVKKLADFYGVTVDYLISGKEEKPTKTDKIADLADKETIFTYEGKEIPPEDLEYMKRILRGGKS